MWNFFIWINQLIGLVWFMVFNATFKNMSVISWRSVLLVEETGVPEESHRPVPSLWQTLSSNVVSSTPRHEWGSNVQLSHDIADILLKVALNTIKQTKELTTGETMENYFNWMHQLNMCITTTSRKPYCMYRSNSI
jgi:hypothetical protein